MSQATQQSQSGQNPGFDDSLYSQFYKTYVQAADANGGVHPVYKALADRVESLVKQALLPDDRTRKLRCILSSRPKDKGDSLKKKLRKKHQDESDPLHPDKPAENVADVRKRIVDLAGARVLLMFPSDRMIVEQRIFDTFDDVRFERRRDAGDTQQQNRQLTNEYVPERSQRFPGYLADHYSVQLPPSENNDDRVVANGVQLDGNPNYRTEIEVYSLFMHAWMEPEHDLYYRETAGKLFAEELGILDAANGLAITGELLMESLKRKLVDRKALNAPATTGGQIAQQLLNKKPNAVYFVGQNLFTLLTRGDFCDELTKWLSPDSGPRARIVVADPDDEKLMKFLEYGFPSFRDDLQESICRLRGLRGTDRLEVNVSSCISRETLFLASFPDDSEEKDVLYLMRVPPGTRPEHRALVKICSQRHPETFEYYKKECAKLDPKELPEPF